MLTDARRLHRALHPALHPALQGLAMLALAMLVAPAARGQGLQASAPWPIDGLDAQHTARSPFNGPSDAFEAWRYLAPHEIDAFDVAADGTLYVSDGTEGLIAVAPGGAEKWQARTLVPVTRFPLVEADGTVVAVADGDAGSNTTTASQGALFAVDPQGRQLWSVPVDPLPTSPGVGPDGTLYVASGDGMLYAVSPQGAVLWSGPLNAAEPSSPVVTPAGLILIGLDDDTLRAISPAGQPAWKFQADGLPYTPAAGPDGSVYFGTDKGSFFALTPTGQMRWTSQTSGSYLGVALAPSGTVYAASTNGEIQAFDANTGALLWQFQAQDAAFNPTVDAAGNLYFSTDSPRDGFVYSIDSSGRLRWRFLATAPNEAAPEIAADGKLYVNAGAGWLIAIAPTPPAAPATSVTLSLSNVSAPAGATVPVALSIGGISGVTAVYSDIGLGASSPAGAPALTAAAPQPGPGLGTGGTVTVIGTQPQLHPGYVSVGAHATNAFNGPAQVVLLPVTVPAGAAPGTVYRLQVGEYEVDGTSNMPIGGVVSVDGTLTVVGSAVPGDLNGDGVVNVADALIAVRALVGLQTLTPAQFSSGDLNHDGKLDLSDVILILRRAVGL